MMEKALTFSALCAAASEGYFYSILAAFLKDSVGHMIPWLIVAFLTIMCDLVVGIRKSYMMGDKVRFSSACRRTMGKMVSYFMFVVMVAAIDVAAEGGGNIEKWACLAVCLVEFSSIMSNILRPKGYELDLAKLFGLIFGKKFNIEKTDLENVLKKNQDENTTGPRTRE